MKKIISLFILVTALLFVVGCDKDEDDSPSVNSVADSFAYAVLKHDSEKICKLMPDEIIEKNYEDLESCIDRVNVFLNSFRDSGDDFETYKIITKSEYNRDRTYDEAEDLEDLYGIPAKDVKGFARYSYKFDRRGSRYDESLRVYLAKIKGDWYVVEIDD